MNDVKVYKKARKGRINCSDPDILKHSQKDERLMYLPNLKIAVSDKGNIYIKNGKRKLSTNGSKYYRIQIELFDKKQKKFVYKVFFIHVLVLFAFSKKLPRLKDKYSEVDHIDGDTYNNDLSNLKFSNRKENNSPRRYSRCPVEKYSLDGEILGQYDSYAQASRDTFKNNYYAKAISKACDDPINRVFGGFHWKRVANN